LVSSKKEKKWEGSRAEIYFNEQIQELIKQKKNHLVETYEGPTEFFQRKLEREDVLSPEEKLEQIQEKKQEILNEEERLTEKIRERERDQKLDELEDKLRDKQDRLDSLLSSEFVSREEAEQQALKSLKSDSRRGWTDDKNDEEIMDTRAFKKKVDKLVCTEDEVEDLKKEVDRLQRRVAELNEGREEWFLDLQEIEVSA